MNTVDVTTFDVYLYVGAGSKTLGSAATWVTVALAMTSMCIIDVSHLYLVPPLA